MLDELLAAYPHAAWQLNSRLNITAHSRASDLRQLGWDVEAVSRPDPSGGRKRQHGYKLASLPPLTTRRSRSTSTSGDSW